jgi:hypothetical protein
LYRFRRAEGKFSPFQEVPEGTDERITAGLLILHDAIRDAQQHPPAAAIARLFDRLELVPLAASRERPGSNSTTCSKAIPISRSWMSTRRARMPFG